MSASLKVISLNIEREKHLDLVLPFLAKEKPDVFCLQEVFEKDIPRFEQELGVTSYFSPMTRFPEGEARYLMGAAIFSRLPIVHSDTQYYRGDPSLDSRSTNGSHRADHPGGN